MRLARVLRFSEYVPAQFWRLRLGEMHGTYVNGASNLDRTVQYESNKVWALTHHPVAAALKAAHTSTLYSDPKHGRKI